MIEFTNYVGTSPGTTVMEIPAMNGLGVCPPGYYGQAIMLPGTPIQLRSDVAAATPEIVALSPYGTESRLAGLGASAIRWDWVMLAFGLTFAGVLGYALYKRR